MYHVQQQVVLAKSCSDPLISGATNALIDAGWPDELLIYKDYYLQNYLYIDKLPGLSWRVVVILPAILQVQYLDSSSSFYAAVIAIATITIAFILFGMAVTLYYIRTRLIKLTRPMFTFMILGGAVTLAISCYVLLGPNDSTNCSVRPWLFNLAFTTSFSPLLIKSWRVHLMFNVNPMSRNKLISNFVLFLYTMSLISVDAFVLGMTIYVGGTGTDPVTKTELTSNGAYASVTYCAYTKNTAFLYGEIVFKGILIGIACFLSFKIRHIAGTIAGSKALLVIVYNTAFVSGVILLITHSVKDVPTIIMCQVLGICFCVIVATALLVLPHMHKLITVGDEEAADDVMQEVFSKASVRATSNREGGRASAVSGYDKRMSEGFGRSSAVGRKGSNADPSVADQAPKVT